MNILQKLTLAALLTLNGSFSAHAVSNAFTYQGSLEDNGAAANGVYDFQFQLKTTGGAVIAGPTVVEDVVVTGGVFSAQLDFGQFFGNDRLISIAVRPGASSGAFTALTPDLPVNATPYASYSNTSGLANDVIDNAIDEINIGTSQVSARNIAANAVTASELAADSVGASELANNSVGIANLIGADYTSPANLNTTINANSCGTFDIAVGGGFEPGDSVILNVVSATSFPSNMMADALRVVSTNVVKVRFCNVGNTNQSLVNQQIQMISIR